MANIYSENLFELSIDKHSFVSYNILTNIRSLIILLEVRQLRRVYNPKVSEKVNKNLDRRAVIVKRQKTILSLIIITIISGIILLSSSIHAFAQITNNKPVHKYYTSIEISDGDTLWDIADEYIGSYNIDKNEYINEICELNHLSNGQIHSGNNIIIAYYSTDIK